MTDKHILFMEHRSSVPYIKTHDPYVVNVLNSLVFTGTEDVEDDSRKYIKGTIRVLGLRRYPNFFEDISTLGISIVYQSSTKLYEEYLNTIFT